MADPGRLERPACGFEVRRSIQLSYGSGRSWGERGDSNPRPLEPQSRALPAELRSPGKNCPAILAFSPLHCKAPTGLEIPGNHNVGLLLSGTGSRAQKTKSVTAGSAPRERRS